jgi:hypothetical protein
MPHGARRHERPSEMASRLLGAWPDEHLYWRSGRTGPGDFRAGLLAGRDQEVERAMRLPRTEGRLTRGGMRRGRGCNTPRIDACEHLFQVSELDQTRIYGRERRSATTVITGKRTLHR